MYKYTESLCQRKDACFYTKVTGKARPAAAGASVVQKKIYSPVTCQRNGDYSYVLASFASNSLERSLTPNLLHSRFDHDSCGVGFVATLRNQPTHEILTQALTALARLAHRGAIAADGKSSDGVGIMTAIPREFLLAPAGLSS